MERNNASQLELAIRFCSVAIRVVCLMCGTVGLLLASTQDRIGMWMFIGTVYLGTAVLLLYAIKGTWLKSTWFTQLCLTMAVFVNEIALHDLKLYLFCCIVVVGLVSAQSILKFLIRRQGTS